MKTKEGLVALKKDQLVEAYLELQALLNTNEAAQKIAVLEAENAGLKDVIRELNERVATQDIKLAQVKTTVEHGGKTYSVAFESFQYNGTVYKAVELKDHPKVVAALIKDESPILVLES